MAAPAPSPFTIDLMLPSLRAALLSAAVVLLPLAGASAQTPPAGAKGTGLPRINVGALPPEAARAVGAAYAEAKSRPGDAAAVGQLAIVLHAWEQWEDAAAAYDAAQQLAPGDYRWWHLAGLMETRRGRHTEALALFDRASGLAPGNRAVQLRVAEASLESGDLERAAALFAKVAGDPRTAAAAEYGLGRIASARP